MGDPEPLGDGGDGGTFGLEFAGEGATKRTGAGGEPREDARDEVEDSRTGFVRQEVAPRSAGGVGFPELPDPTEQEPLVGLVRLDGGDDVVERGGDVVVAVGWFRSRSRHG